MIFIANLVVCKCFQFEPVENFVVCYKVFTINPDFESPRYKIQNENIVGNEETLITNLLAFTHNGFTLCKKIYIFCTSFNLPSAKVSIINNFFKSVFLSYRIKLTIYKTIPSSNDY